MKPIDDTDTGLELRSFGRRRGRKLSPRQQDLIDTLLPRIAIDVASPRDIAALAAEHDLWLEIGFGGGEHLIAQAEQHRAVTIIGCEPFEEGQAKVLTAIAEKGIENIRLHGDDARDVLRALPDRCVNRAFVLFPDPWPKKKHQKRRLVGSHLLQLLARVMKPKSELRLATDIADYARTMLMAVQQQRDFVWTAGEPDAWRTRPADWPPTRYEQKARREGRPCCYLTLQRTA